MNLPIRVLLVDDHVAFRVSLALFLAGEADLLVVAQAGTVAAACTVIAASGPIDVALVDLRLPDGDGIEVVRTLRQATPRTRALVLTAVFDPAHHARAMAAGATSIISKATHPTDILIHVRRAAEERPISQVH